MALTAGLRPSLGQRLALTPAMRSSLAVLRMPADTLREEIEREAADNPFLIVDDAPGQSGSYAGAYDDALAVSAAAVSLIEALTQQIATQRLDAVTEAAAIYLASELTDEGYLATPLQEIAGATGVSLPTLEAGLAAVQACDPPGVGARSLRECLSLQLVDAGMQPGLARAVVAALDDFAEGRWSKLSRLLDLPVAEVERIGGLIRGLSPVPVRGSASPVITRIPDLIVERSAHGSLSVHLNPAALPTLSVMQADRTDKANAPVLALLDRARQFATAIEMRGETLLRIGRAITTAQPKFFLGGQDTLVPLNRTDLANALGVHPSTIGRAVADKSLVTSGKIHPLGLFFTRALPGADGAVSSFDVQIRIRSLIAAEDGMSPLADDHIAAQLQDEGVDIARRTVAKYRKCMRIPSSFRRRRRPIQIGPRARATRRTDNPPN